MKRIIFILSIACICSSTVRGAVVKTDPVLTAAIVAETVELKKVYEDRKKTEEAVLVAEETTNFNLDRIHKIEKQALDYLSNAQGAVQNLYQIKQATELVKDQIPGSIKALQAAVPEHLVGTAVSTVVSKQITRAYTEMASLLPYMQQLVTSGTYNVGGTSSDGKSEKHKVNLLNSYERYSVAQEVLTRLRRINQSIQYLTYEIKTLGVKDCISVVDAVSWRNYNTTKNGVSDIINQWKRIK